MQDVRVFVTNGQSYEFQRTADRNEFFKSLVRYRLLIYCPLMTKYYEKIGINLKLRYFYNDCVLFWAFYFMSLASKLIIMKNLYIRTIKDTHYKVLDFL